MTDGRKNRHVPALAVTAALLVVAAAVSASAFVARGRLGRERAVLYFPSLDSERLCTEVRWLPREPLQGREALFVDELLLGPMTNRYQPLFAPGTRCEFCVEQGGVLYVGLSREALGFNARTAELRVAVEVFRLNIVRKFTGIRAVRVYIDGKAVYEDG